MLNTKSALRSKDAAVKARVKKGVLVLSRTPLAELAYSKDRTPRFDCCDLREKYFQHS